MLGHILAVVFIIIGYGWLFYQGYKGYKKDEKNKWNREVELIEYKNTIKIRHDNQSRSF